MNNFQQRYKKKPLGFTDTDDGRLVRTVKHEEQRRLRRAKNFSRHRNVPEVQEIEEPTNSDTTAKLRRWKAERDIRRKVESLKKKPAFKVGVVHHKFYSPPASSKTVVNGAPCHTRGAHRVKHQPTPEKRITRATQKRLDAKLAGAASSPAKAPNFQQKASRSKPTRKKQQSMTKKAEISFAPQNHEFKPPTGLTEIPLFGRFVIPKDVDIRQSWHSKVDVDPQADEEKPMQIMQNMLSLVSLDAPSRRDDSSIESVALRLPSEDENLGATDSTRPETDTATGRDFPDGEIAVNVEELAAADVETDTRTPPRSGTPVPAAFSPYIVSSRGKRSARKEQKTKMGIRRSSPDDVPTKDNVMQTLNISVEEEERTAQYFKFILERETERLTGLCEKWKETMNEPDLTENARYQINAAVGQTTLLIRKKFARFRCLVTDCETGKGEMLVQCRDLQGFWDLMSMEIKDCESRFLKLDFLRARGWIEEPQVAAIGRKATRTKVAATKPKIAAKSSARSWIIAARKNKMSLVDDCPVHFSIAVRNTETETYQSEVAPSSPGATNSRLGSRRKSPPPPTEQNRRRNTPNSLLKRVQISEVSRSVKTPEVKLDDSITYVNSGQTPGKGILKRSDDSASPASCSPKSGRKVDFDHVYLEEFPVEDEAYEALQNSMDLGRALARIEALGDDDLADEAFPAEDSDEDAGNEALHNSIDLGRALARIEAYDENSDDVTPEDFTKENPSSLGKRLDFEEISSDETETREIAETVITTSHRVSKTRGGRRVVETSTRSASQTVIRSTRSGRRSSSVSEVFEDFVEEKKTDESLVAGRVLRNRIVAAEAGNKSNRRNGKSSGTDEQFFSVSSSAKENSDPRREREETTSETSEDTAKRRRSTRRSVKLNADDRAAHTPNKFALPKTPHSRRSRKISLLGSISRESVLPPINGDLMSFDSP